MRGGGLASESGTGDECFVQKVATGDGHGGRSYGSAQARAWARLEVVGLYKPKQLVEAAGDGGDQIGRHFVVGIVGIFDKLSCQRGKVSQ